MHRPARSLLLLSFGMGSFARRVCWAAPASRVQLPGLLRPLFASGASLGAFRTRCTEPSALAASDDASRPASASASASESSRAGPTATAQAAAAAPILSVNPHLDASLPYRTLAFYIISRVPEPAVAVEAHRAFLARRGMVGRVYICADGINAQVSGKNADCAAYRSFCHGLMGAGAGAPILFKEDPTNAPAFPRLRVKNRGLVANTTGDGEALDLSNRGVDLSPLEWERMLAAAAEEGGDKRPIVLDVRNDYEWDVGRFDGASRPVPTNFAQSDEESYNLPADLEERADTPVIMYCTGGIRCEFFSARLKARGFKNVYKLQGGVQHYGNAYATEERAPPGWKGSLFVFDRRNTVPIGGGGAAEVVGVCLHCGGKTETFVNCGNIDCNKLHLACPTCLPATGGFCCAPCGSAPRRRPLTDPSATQGPRPGAIDPNRLSAVKPDNIGRKEWVADADGFRPGAGSS